jgi:hypothetical protein
MAKMAHFLLISLVAVASMVLAFDVECGLPNDSEAYVSSPNTRGTLDILYTCLATIFACTYSSLHLNVPTQRPERDPSSPPPGDMQWNLARLLEKCGWALLTALVPELILWSAAYRLARAKSALRELRKAWGDTQGAWTLRHLLYAEMGGFIVQYYECPSPSRRQRKQWHLTAHSVVGLLKSNLLKVDPPESDEELADKSKSDAFAKTIAMGQIIYFVVGVIARAVERLAISPLELGTCAIITCTIFTYAFNFSAPKGIMTTVTIAAYDKDVPAAVKDIIATHDEPTRGTDRGPIPNGRFFVSTALHIDLFFLGQATVFGAVHLIWYNLTFPTMADRRIWQVAAISATVVPGVVLIIDIAFRWADTHEIESEIVEIIGTTLLGLGSLLYGLSRLALIVEMFRSLSYLTPDAFMTTWTANIPHIG